MKKTSLLAAVAIALAGLLPARAVSIYDASFDSTGALKTSGSQVLDNFIVMGIYYNNTTAFIYDGTAWGRIYGSSFVSGLQVGGEYSGVSVTSSVYQSYQEFTSASGGTLISSSNPPTPISILDISTISSTSPQSASPSGGGNWLQQSAMIEFTFTPQGDSTPSGTGSANLVDMSGTTIQFYRSVTTSTLTGGQAYTVDAYVQGYSGHVELVGATFTAVPEPSTMGLVTLGGVSALGVFLRRRKAAVSVS